VLNKPGGYIHREALFGDTPYGKLLRHTLYYAKSDLCDPHSKTLEEYPASGKEEDDKAVSASWLSPFILMIDRGECTFVEQVRNAQKAGAAAVIIADNAFMCTEVDSVSRGADCQTRAPSVAGDETSHDIRIPSVLMLKSDADAVKEALKTQETVKVEMQWPMPTSSDRVEVEFWSAFESIKTVRKFHAHQDLLDGLQRIIGAFRDRVSFSPYMIVNNYCSNSSGYCFPQGSSSPGPGTFVSRTSSSAVTESLRRMCIWKEYGADDGIGLKWWSYAEYFLRECTTKISDKNKKCIEKQYAANGIDGNFVDRCVAENSGPTIGFNHSLLENEMSLRNHRWGEETMASPTFVVNGVQIRGQTSLRNVFNAICAGYKDGEEPIICTQCFDCKGGMRTVSSCMSGYVSRERCTAAFESKSHSQISPSPLSQENRTSDFFLGCMVGLALGCTIIGSLFGLKNRNMLHAASDEKEPARHSYEMVATGII